MWSIECRQDNAITFKILSNDKVRDVNAITTSSFSVSKWQLLAKLSVTTAVAHVQQFIVIQIWDFLDIVCYKLDYYKTTLQLQHCMQIKTE